MNILLLIIYLKKYLLILKLKKFKIKAFEKFDKITKLLCESILLSVIFRN